MLVQIELLFSNSDNDDVKSSFRLDYWIKEVYKLWWETLKCDGKCIILLTDWRRVPRAYLGQRGTVGQSLNSEHPENAPLFFTDIAQKRVKTWHYITFAKNGWKPLKTHEFIVVISRTSVQSPTLTREHHLPSSSFIPVLLLTGFVWPLEGIQQMWLRYDFQNYSQMWISCQE